MPPPYGRCVKKIPIGVYNLYPNNTYVLQNCLRSCRQQRAIKTCGCADPRFAKFKNDMLFCTIKNGKTYFFLNKNN